MSEPIDINQAEVIEQYKSIQKKIGHESPEAAAVLAVGTVLVDRIEAMLSSEDRDETTGELLYGIRDRLNGIGNAAASLANRS